MAKDEKDLAFFKGLILLGVKQFNKISIPSLGIFFPMNPIYTLENKLFSIDFVIQKCTRASPSSNLSADLKTKR
jgi:hypothetical protein